MKTVTQAAAIEVLLVDDDDADVLLTSKMLQRGKLLLDVSVAHHGEQAYELLVTRVEQDQRLPDVILLDINMPRMNGFELLKLIKAHPTLHRIPVIMLTTSDSPYDVDQGYRLGANSYITKPVTFEQLKNIISIFNDFWFTIVKLPQSES